MAGASSDELERKSTLVRGFYFFTEMFTITSASHLGMYPELLPLSAGSGIGAVVIGRLYSAPSQARFSLLVPRTGPLNQRDEIDFDPSTGPKNQLAGPTTGLHDGLPRRITSEILRDQRLIPDGPPARSVCT